jgi:flagellar biosynthetic protein FliQ
MDAALLVESLTQAALAGVVVALPVLATGLAVGLVAGLVQAATGVHEPIVGLVPKLAAMAAVLVFTLPWMVERLADLVRLSTTP